MNETKKMQTLHQRSIRGEILSIKEQTELQNWYESLDSDEDSILNNAQPIQNVEELSRNLGKITEQTAEVSREIETLILQNELIRRVNKDLNKSLRILILGEKQR